MYKMQLLLSLSLLYVVSGRAVDSKCPEGMVRIQKPKKLPDTVNFSTFITEPDAKKSVGIGNIINERSCEERSPDTKLVPGLVELPKNQNLRKVLKQPGCNKNGAPMKKHGKKPTKKELNEAHRQMLANKFKKK